jgi:hypothetical protein
MYDTVSLNPSNPSHWLDCETIPSLAWPEKIADQPCEVILRASRFARAGGHAQEDRRRARTKTVRIGTHCASYHGCRQFSLHKGDKIVERTASFGEISESSVSNKRNTTPVAKRDLRKWNFVIIF